MEQFGAADELGFLFEQILLNLILSQSLSLWNQISACVRLFESAGDYPFNLSVMHTVYIVGPVPNTPVLMRCIIATFCNDSL